MKWYKIVKDLDMANTTIVSKLRANSVNEGLEKRLAKFYRSFCDVHREVLEEKSFSPKTIFCQPHDVILAVDRSSILVIASKGTSTEVSSTDRYFDFTSRGSVDPRELMKSAKRDLKWESMTYLQFNRGLLDVSEEVQREEFRRVSETMVEDMQKRNRVTERLGISEAITHVENARTRFFAKDASGFKDCNEHLKGAIDSLMSSVTGKESVEEALKKLKEEGILGEPEAKIIEAIKDFVSDRSFPSTCGFAIPEEENVLFKLRLTEALIDYIVKLVERTKAL